MTDTALVTTRCDACGASSLRAHRRSHLTGHVILACRTCGLRTLQDRPTMADLARMAEDLDEERYATWVGTTRTETIESSHAEVLDRLSTLVGPREGRSLFDVGAGDGGFLAQARDHGFDPHGSELAPGAVDLARAKHGIELALGDLDELADAGQHDALTMWCVLAHVPDGTALLRAAMPLLKPGGVLYLQTPRWCAMDTLGMAAHDVTGGRFTKITDRRLALHHMALHSRRSMRTLLEGLGYEVEAVEPRARYSLTTPKYLGSLGFSPSASRRVAGVVDAFVDRDLFFRNVLDVYARRPR